MSMRVLPTASMWWVWMFYLLLLCDEYECHTCCLFVMSNGAWIWVCYTYCLYVMSMSMRVIPTASTVCDKYEYYNYTYCYYVISISIIIIPAASMWWLWVWECYLLLVCDECNIGMSYLLLVCDEIACSPPLISLKSCRHMKLFYFSCSNITGI